MTTRSWIRKMFESRTPRTMRKAPTRCRPSLETLEDRSLLASSTSTSLLTSVNPSVFGQPVTLTAVVSPVPPATGFPLGTVTFNDGGTAIGTGTLTTPFKFSEFPVPTAGSQPNELAAGSDGSLWFTEFNASKIGRITTSGTFTEFSVPAAGTAPHGITAGPDGNLWFTEFNGNRIGRITTSGTFTEFPVPSGINGLVQSWVATVE